MSSPKGRVGIVAVSGGNDSDRGQMFVEDYCDWIGIPAIVGKGISLRVFPRSKHLNRRGTEPTCCHQDRGSPRSGSRFPIVLPAYPSV